MLKEILALSKIPNWSCDKFLDETFSKEPVPGGGGVAALVGGLGTALAGMVCNLTIGKKKYAEYENDLQEILKKAEFLKAKFSLLIDLDAENFYPLSQCYSLPRNTEEEKAIREEKIQEGLKKAVLAPIEMVKISYDAIKLMDELSEKGSKMVLSDVGCGVLCLKASLQAAWLNVLVNLKSIKDKEFTNEIEDELLTKVTEGEFLADKIYEEILNYFVYEK